MSLGYNGRAWLVLVALNLSCMVFIYYTDSILLQIVALSGTPSCLGHGVSSILT